MNATTSTPRKISDSDAAPVSNRVPPSPHAAPVAHNAEGAAVVAPRASLAALLSGHILRDGEIIVLILKPSPWYVLLSSLRFIGSVLVVCLASKVFEPHLPAKVPGQRLVEAASFLIAGRLMWATLQWMGRLYILTDLRVLRVQGVFGVDVFDCPLRKIARTELIRTVRERLFALGSVVIVPTDEACPIGYWQTISHPRGVREQIVAAINRARGDT